MSRLTNGPHTVLLTNIEITDERDANDDLIKIPTTVTVKNCSLRPLTTDEVQAFGGSTFADTHYSISHKDWQGVMGSHVEWDGLEFQQVGQTRRHMRGQNTKRTTAHLRMLPTVKKR